MAQEKEYTGTFTLGATTPTYDLESEPENFKTVEGIDLDRIKTVAEKFTGEIMQLPPAHSAIKVDGKRSYELARQGKTTNLEPRKLLIREFEIISIDQHQSLPIVDFRVICSTGTYIRSLAYDLGEALGTGAFLSNLRRTRIGTYQVENAETLDQLDKRVRELPEQA